MPIFLKNYNKILNFSYKGTNFPELPEENLNLSVAGKEMYIENEKYILRDDNSFGYVVLFEKNKFGKKKCLFDFEYKLSFEGDELLEITSINNENKTDEEVVGYFEIILENQPIYLISTIPITIDSLALQPAVRYNSDPTLEEVRIQWWKQNGIDDPPFVLDVNDCLTAVEIINAGLGYSIITEDMMKKCKLGLYTKKLYDKEGIPLTRTTKLICKSAMLGSGTISAFISFIKDYFHVDSPI